MDVEQRYADEPALKRAADDGAGARDIVIIRAKVQVGRVAPEQVLLNRHFHYGVVRVQSQIAYSTSPSRFLRSYRRCYHRPVRPATRFSGLRGAILLIDTARPGRFRLQCLRPPATGTAQPARDGRAVSSPSKPLTLDAMNTTPRQNVKYQARGKPAGFPGYPFAVGLQ